MKALDLSLRGVSYVTGVFALLVAIMMALQFVRTMEWDPLDAPALADMRVALLRDGQNEALRTDIRNLDLRIRRVFFSNLDRLRVGSGLLAAGATISLLCFQASREIRRRVRSPGKADADAEVAMLTRSRLLVVVFAGLLILVGFSMALLTRSRL